MVRFCVRAYCSKRLCCQRVPSSKLPGQPAFTQAMRCITRGSVVLIFALPDPGAEVPFPIHDLWMEGVVVTSTYAGAPDDFRAAIEMIAGRRIAVADMISHRLPLEGTPAGFALVAAARGALKVVVFPHGTP